MSKFSFKFLFDIFFHFGPFSQPVNNWGLCRVDNFDGHKSTDSSAPLSILHQNQWHLHVHFNGKMVHCVPINKSLRHQIIKNISVVCSVCRWVWSFALNWVGEECIFTIASSFDYKARECCMKLMGTFYDKHNEFHWAFGKCFVLQFSSFNKTFTNAIISTVCNFRLFSAIVIA